MLKNKILTILIVLTFACIPFFAHAQSAQAQLRIISAQRDVAVGENISLLVRVRTNDSINALSGSLRFSPNLEVVSFSREASIVNFWIKEPHVLNSRISFEGVILNPGFTGSDGAVVRIAFKALREGTASVIFEQGSLLANDGMGTNILSGFENASFTITPSRGIPLEEGGDFQEDQVSSLPLPVITEYNEIVGTKEVFRLKGIGAPNKFTRIQFDDSSFKTLGEQFILWLQTNKEVPSDILVKNNENGEFEFSSPANFVAGSYNITPTLVDLETQSEKQGFSVKIFVQQSPTVRFLVVFINILLLLVPIVLLGVLVYFIPWYSRLRMRVLKHKTELEDQEIHLAEVALKKKVDNIENCKNNNS